MAFLRHIGPIAFLLILTASQAAAYQQVELVRELGAKEKDKKSDQCKLTGPHALAVAGNAYYIADTEAHRVVVMDREGKAVKTWGTKGGKPGQFKSPSGIALDEDGRVYVSDTGNNRIQRVTPDGIIATVAGSGPPASNGQTNGGFSGDGGPATSASLSRRATEDSSSVSGTRHRAEAELRKRWSS